VSRVARPDSKFSPFPFPSFSVIDYTCAVVSEPRLKVEY
jgi:hypothetical protein